MKKLVTTTFVILSFLNLCGNSSFGKQTTKKQTTITPTCTTSECHSKIKKNTFVHEPVSANSCDVCHLLNKDQNAPNNSKSGKNHPNLLPIQKNTISETCFECHDSLGKALKTSQKPHGAIQKANCIHCHDPHGSKQKFFLKANSPSELCFSCHQELQKDLKKYSVPHQALYTKNSCLACHEAHVSQQPNLLKEPLANVCFSCHSKAIQSKDGHIIRDMKSWIKTKATVHNPVSEGSCNECHLPHGSQHKFLLKNSYPEDVHANPSVQAYGLCLNCHSQELIEKPVVTDEETGFRNGQQNLHYLHIQGLKPAHSCRACHDAHASENPKLINTSFRFLQQNLPIIFRKTETGGNCTTACHKTKYYDQKKAFINEKGR